MPSLPQRLKGETSAEFCKRIGREPRVKKSRVPKVVEEVASASKEEVPVEEVAVEEVKEESATPKED
tara:strand:- start:296 stop:496 length:201 start_codon:yes stop_codon:yes gene_type:complete